MKEKQFIINDPDGIHARPAGILVKKMQDFACTVTFEKGEKRADGKRLFAVMKLAVKKGETLTIRTEGDQEDAAIAAAVEVFNETGL